METFFPFPPYIENLFSCNELDGTTHHIIHTMGLSIYYSGRFNPQASLKAMIEEVIDIVNVHRWKFHLFNDTFCFEDLGKTEYDKKLFGICFIPPGCEPVWLSFLSNGRMCGADNLQLFGNSANKEEEEYLYLISSKTQYSGIENHKRIIHILKYISEKYLLYFSMTDEGEYWETGDEDLLKEIFSSYNYIIDSFSNSLENNPRRSDESYEAYFTRILKRIPDES